MSTRLLLGVVACLVVATGVIVTVSRGSAPAADMDARVLKVERQLLCPQCTNKRLDVCDQAICEDMRREIRMRLERGETEPQIVAFFAGRFGDRVLASVPMEGFNLWLWGWVAAVIALAWLAAWSWLARSRVPLARATAVLDAATEGWLDAQLRDEPAGPSGGRGVG